MRLARWLPLACPRPFKHRVALHLCSIGLWLEVFWRLESRVLKFVIVSFVSDVLSFVNAIRASGKLGGVTGVFRGAADIGL